MDLSNLNELYNHREFKPSHSRKADEAMAKVLGTLRPGDDENYTFDKFWQAWQELLAVLAEELSGVSPSNLCALSTPLMAKRLCEENLTILLLAETIAPQSDQLQAMLGLAYGNVGNLESAATHFQKAYDLAIQHANEREFELSNPLRLDASDYLRYLAEIEVKRNHGPQALLAAIRAHEIVRRADVGFKDGDVCDTLYRVCLAMRLDKLAEDYRVRAKAAREKHPR